MVEIWRPIQGYEGLYEVSNLGNVKSLSRNALLSKHKNNRGYYRGGKWVSVSQSYGFVWKFAE